MSTSPQYASTPKVGIGQVSVANANRDGTGTIATIFTAGSSGSRVDVISIKAVGTTTAGMIRFYIHDGTNARLLTETKVSAITPSATAISFEEVMQLLGGLLLPTGYSLRASTEKAETFNIIAQGGDL